MDKHKQRQLEMYGQALDAISEAMTMLHPIGQYKAIGRLESVAAFTQWMEGIAAECLDRDKCRKVIDLLRNRYAELQAAP